MNHRQDIDGFSSDFDRVYASKNAAAYRKMLRKRTQKVLMRRVLQELE